MSKTLKARFHEKVWVNLDTGCWEWVGASTAAGYGRIEVSGRSLYAHRATYEMHVGPIPDGLQIDHLCRVRHCVNPEHLEPVTSRENTLRGQGGHVAMASRTHCPRGHEYSAANTYFHPRGQRACRACNLAATRRRRRGGGV